VIRVAFDTNLLAYAEGLDDQRRARTALDVIARVPPALAVIPVQVLGELYRVLTRKAGFAPERARAAIHSWQDGFPIFATGPEALQSAMDLSAEHRLSFWDALIFSVAAEAGCRLLLTEDLQDGFTWRGVTAVNPFAEKRHPLLATALAG
jgi:predicted nucleic acid-binding protein